MDTRRALLDSAEKAVRRSGYDGFSYADLAEEVGIRTASIHYHFPRKAALALALMQRYAAKGDRQLARIDADAPSGGERLTGQIARYRKALDEGRQLCLCVAFSVSPNPLEQELIAEIERFRERSVDWLTSVFTAGKQDGTIGQVAEPEAEARACLALLEGAHLATRVSRDLRVFDRTVALLKDRIQS